MTGCCIILCAPVPEYVLPAFGVTYPLRPLLKVVAVASRRFERVAANFAASKAHHCSRGSTLAGRKVPVLNNIHEA